MFEAHTRLHTILDSTPHPTFCPFVFVMNEFEPWIAEKAALHRQALNSYKDTSNYRRNRPGRRRRVSNGGGGRGEAGDENC